MHKIHNYEIVSTDVTNMLIICDTSLLTIN